VEDSEDTFDEQAGSVLRACTYVTWSLPASLCASLLGAACQMLSAAGGGSVFEAECALLWPFVASLAGKCSQVNPPRVASAIARTFDLESSAVMTVNHEVGGRAQARHAHAESQCGACCGVGV
jgi:hypothetical protein